MQDMTFAAEYTKGSKAAGHDWLDLVWIDARSGSRHVIVSDLEVANKRHARQVAVREGATPWNF